MWFIVLVSLRSTEVETPAALEATCLFSNLGELYTSYRKTDLAPLIPVRKDSARFD